MRDNISSGVGQYNGTVAGVVFNRRDLQPDFSAEIALAGTPALLVERVASRLTYGSAGTALKTEIIDAVAKLPVVVITPTGGAAAAADDGRRARVNAAILLTLASPEFLVQK
jgi:phosphoribosylcarboxyaminoimidazole (NCAIR) mutase